MGVLSEAPYDAVVLLADAPKLSPLSEIVTRLVRPGGVIAGAVPGALPANLQHELLLYGVQCYYLALWPVGQGVSFAGRRGEA